MKRLIKILALAAVLAVAYTAESAAQHTIAVTGGTGFATARPYPSQEMRPIWGTYQAGFSWRYYSMPRFVACFGIDVELMQRGYSFAPYSYLYEKKKDYKYYTRKINSIVIPIVWQPHFYLFKNRMRVYLEAAVTFSYNFASTFENKEPYTFGSLSGQGHKVIEGKYTMRPERDNRFCYGLAGGGGIDFLYGQMEFGVRARYDFGYSDILKNRNKYYDNALDQKLYPAENPFWYSPLRSPLDNLTISLRVGFRFNKKGFDEWFYKPPKRDKQVVKFAL